MAGYRERSPQITARAKGTAKMAAMIMIAVKVFSSIGQRVARFCDSYMYHVRIARHGFAAYMLGTSPEYYSAKVPTKRLRRASYFALKQHSTGKLRIHDVKR
jgi:hypothetical protein